MGIDANIIGRKIQMIRKKHNLTQEQLAEFADISVVYVSKLENGQRIPSLETLVSICNALDCSMDELLQEHLKISKYTQHNEIGDLFDNASIADKKFVTQLLSLLHTYL